MDQMVPIKFVLMGLTKNQGSANGRRLPPIWVSRESAYKKTDAQDRYLSGDLRPELTYNSRHFKRNKPRHGMMRKST